MTRRRIALILPFLLVACFSFKCDSGAGNATDIRAKYERATADLSAAVAAMITKKRTLAQELKITAAEEDLLTTQLLQINSAVRAIQAQGPLSKALPSLESSVRDLNQSVSSINQADSRSQLQQLTQSLEANTRYLVSVSDIAASKCRDVGGGCVICKGDPCTYCPGLPRSCPQD